MAKSTFIVNWQVQGFRNKIHEAGAFIVAEVEEVEDLIKEGCISLWDKVKGVKVVATATVAVAEPGSGVAEGAGTSDKPELPVESVI
jgi:hypothetical protein